MRQQLTAIILALAFVRLAIAEPPQSTDNRIRAAVERAIPLIEAGSAGSAEQRTCFTCHNQALPILALTEARRRGFVVDEGNLERQLAHTLAHLERGKANYLEGKGQGGKSITAGYALWALDVGGHTADETTAAVVAYLLRDQKVTGQWSHPGTRPPTSGSDFTTTCLALRGLAAYGTPEQQPTIKSAIASARQWLAKIEPGDTEDQVFRIRALKVAESDRSSIQSAAAAILESQREDGGWAQTTEMHSDTYATSTVLAALLQANEVTIDTDQLQQGLQFLLDAQLEDGSWHVATRAKPFQTYYESGFPHDEDQFISIAASSWATLALVLSLDEGAKNGDRSEMTCR